jgi:hypothetical protein
MKNRNLDHSDNWATPDYFYNELNEEFNFDFDPCPYNTGELDFDGLKIEWGGINYVNPPYSQKLKEQFVLKAIEESKKGKICVMLLPVSTSTKLFHDHIQPNAKEIRFLRGRIKFIGTTIDKKTNEVVYVNWRYWNKIPPTGVREANNSGMHDSMIVIFKK